jgi:hypothetical protein
VRVHGRLQPRVGPAVRGHTGGGVPAAHPVSDGCHVCGMYTLLC